MAAAALVPTPAKPAGPIGAKDDMVNLVNYIDVGKATGLNLGAKSVAKSVLTGEGSIVSDCDAQILLMVPFKEAVKIRGICFQGPAETTTADASSPAKVKLWVNRTNLDFSDAETDKNVTETIVLKAADVTDGREQLIKFVKFQNVHSITVFIESNQGKSELTTLSKLSFIGAPIAGMNMADLKACKS